MPTAKTILSQFVEEQGIGRVGATSAAGSTTTLVDASSRFAGPKSGNEWERGSPIRVTSGAAGAASGDAIGQNTELSDSEPATGTLTVSPAITTPGTAPVSFFILHRRYADHADRLFEALSRGLNRWARRRMKVPLTFVTDGDLLGSAVGTYWTGTTATPTYSDLSHPNGYYTRVLNIVTSGANGYAVPANIPCHPSETWDLVTWMRANAATSTAELIIRDVTNSAVITPTIETGALTTTSRSLTLVKISFEIPTGCYLWVPRLTGQENPATVQFGPVIAAPRETKRYTSQAHFEFPSEAGKFFAANLPSGTDQGPEEISFDEMPYACDIEQLGWGLGFGFRTTPDFPLYYEALLGYADLTAEADSTYCPEDLALAAMGREFWQTLQTRDMRDDGSSPWDRKVKTAEDTWKRLSGHFGPERIVNVRRAYQGRVIL